MNLSHAPAYYVAVAFKLWVQAMAYTIVMMVNGHVGDAYQSRAANAYD